MRTTSASDLKTGALTLLLVWPVACGGDSVPPREVAQDEFPAAYAAAFCALTVKCCNAEELTALDSAITDRASCEARYRAFFDQSANIAQGIVKYDPEQGAACVDALAALDCRIPAGLIPACERFYRGTKANGQGCRMDWECVGGLCGSFPGEALQCHQLSKEGEPCGSSLDCLPWLGCSDQRHVCVAHSRGIGQSCEDNSECVTELCDGKICRAPQFCDGK